MSKRPKRVRETAEYAGMVRRIIRAYGRRVADRDLEELAGLAALRADLDTAIGDAVTGLRSAGFSWTDIARVMGTSRQGAQQRWGR
jgi:hypothetical protein